MAADTAIQEEEGPAGTTVERDATTVPERVPITPPASVRDSAGFLPIAPGVPATGTGGYITQQGEIPYAAAARAKAEEEAAAAREQQNFQSMLLQSARTENALKAIQAQKRFLATRKLGSDYQRAVSTGLPPAQAWAMAASRNLEAFGNRLSDVTSAIHAARPVVAPAWHPPNPQTGAPGYFETGQGTIHVPAVDRQQISPVQQQEIRWRNDEISNARKDVERIKSQSPAWADIPEMKKQVDDLEKLIESRANEVRNILGGNVTSGTSSPSANNRNQSLIDQANEAIRKGADPQKVKERLKKLGVEVEMNVPGSAGHGATGSWDVQGIPKSEPPYPAGFPLSLPMPGYSSRA